MDVELIQFLYSPYNEKARWALDLKGVARAERSLLPGPHLPVVKRLTGQTATPVVRFGDRYVHGSARILAELDEMFPDPPLYPADPDLRREALEIEARFDDDLGPRIRRAVLDGVIGEPRYVARMFGADQPAWSQALYAAVFPLVRIPLKKGNGITGPASVEDGYAAARIGLDFVAERAGAGGYLVGGAFSVADLAAASILATLCSPPDSSMDRPRPLAARLARLIDTFRDHPGTAWVLDMYRRHRYPGGA
ncbi:MAG: glutathione S-transferase [Hyphomicrobiales bacterium]|nr:glutathione S-transferase [Hyphomicrobiales bacterium]